MHNRIEIGELMNTYLWVFILFGMTVMLWTLGFQPLFFSGIDKYGGVNYGSITSLITNYLSTWDGLLTTAGAIVVGALVGGLNMLVLIPFVLANFLLNLFVFPTEYLADGFLPIEVSILLRIFFNLVTYLVLIHFLRG